jgi:hypothetical protein
MNRTDSHSNIAPPTVPAVVKFPRLMTVSEVRASLARFNHAMFFDWKREAEIL